MSEAGRGRFKVTRAESREHVRWKREAEKHRAAQAAKYEEAPRA